MHVADIADAHFLAIEYLKNGGPSAAVNLGTSSGNSVLQVIDSVRRVTDRDPKVLYGERRSGDPTRLVASNEKAREMLDWEPQRSEIDTIVEDAWRWLEAHPNGYAR